MDPQSVAVPPPADLTRPVGALVRELADHLGEAETVGFCVELLRGAHQWEHLPELAYLTGHLYTAADPCWHEYWGRTWGARGLLYVWDDSATPAVVAGLGDDHWRPAEMCLKVTTKREIGEAGPCAARLLAAELPRVRAQAVRCLGVVGDTEHVAAVRALLGDPDHGVRRTADRALETMARRLDL